MLEHPLMHRQTRSGIIRGSPSPLSRGRVVRGHHQRGGNRIQPIVWNQNQDMQMMGGELNET